MTTMWQAVIRAQVPGNGQSWNGRSYQSNTIGQIVSVRVPDTGGYFATKSMLEGAYGAGSVVSLVEAR